MNKTLLFFFLTAVSFVTAGGFFAPWSRASENAPDSPADQSSAPESSAPKSFEADVVIYGGTSAAVIAAVQVEKMGKSALIVSPDLHLGGLSSAGLGSTDSGVKSVIGGLSREFYHRIWRHYQENSAWTFQKRPNENGDEETSNERFGGIDGKTETMWVFEPHAAEKIFDDFIRENEISVWRGERLDRERGVVMDGKSIRSITTLSGKVFSGRMFIDATYEGDLLAAAGVTFTVGREANALYDETLNGIQTEKGIYHQFSGPVDPYVERGNPASGLLPTVNPSAGGPDGAPDKKLQAYCYRLCLTNVPENRIPFEKPADYSEADYELLFRSIEAGQNVFCTFSRMPNGKTDSNNNKAVSTDFIGRNYDYPEASYERRAEILAHHTRWEKGLFWTLANHPRVPEEIRKLFSSWGLAKDEFTDNGGWPHQIYVREARRMVGEFVVSERHLRRLDETPRSVGMGSYNMDSHHAQRYVAADENGRPTVLNEGDVQVNPGAPYPIDYGTLLPKASECDNLLVPVCVSCSHIAYGSIRMEPVFMILGQSAATAAVLSMENRTAPQSLDYAELADRLTKDGQILESDSVWPEK